MLMVHDHWSGTYYIDIGVHIHVTFFRSFFLRLSLAFLCITYLNVPTLLPLPCCTVAQVSAALCTDVLSSPSSLSDHTVNSNPASFSLQWFPSHLNITSILPLYLILALPASLPAPYIYYVLAEFTVFKACLETSCFRAFLFVCLYLQICLACFLSSAVAILSHLSFSLLYLYVFFFKLIIS